MTDSMLISLALVGVLLVVLVLLRLRHVSMQSFILGLIGAILGLLVGALASVPASHLPGIAGSWVPLGISAITTFVLMVTVLARRRQITALAPWLLADSTHAAVKPESTTGQAVADAPATSAGQLPRLLVDTSAIIDGRIADIAAAGFMPGRLVVPRFVLAELQNIADSEDAMRRSRGRRGLEVLARLQETPGVVVEIIDDDIEGMREVDAKLVMLGQKFHCNVLTTDYNLNQVAGIQGVRVLNVNELSNAIRPVVLPGEELRVRVVQPGKERNQGVGYLTDGTMIVVENGDKLIGQEIATEVTRVFQTVAGKMIFAAPKGQKTDAKAGATPTAQAQLENLPAIANETPQRSNRGRKNARPHRRPTE